VHGGGIHQRWLQRARATRTADGVTITIANDAPARPRLRGNERHMRLSSSYTLAHAENVRAV
jgi:hypothetical protein